MNFLLSIIPTVIVLGVLIVIHEFGHFLACRLAKVKVEKFSIGFGPEILRWQGKETSYVISLFPLGGFVKPAGESISEVGEGGPKPGDYLAAPLFSRIVIVCAGVAMNYFLAYFLFVAIFMIGRPMPGTTIGDFVPNYPAAQSGLQAGDRIMEVDNKPVRNWMELIDTISKSPSEQVALTVQRAGEPLQINITPKVEKNRDFFGKEVVVKKLGITPHPAATQFEKYGFVTSLGKAWKTEVYLTTMTYQSIVYLILGKISVKSMAGPIGIIAMTGDAARRGLPYILQLTATLSISLAVINLMPIPALDGGHLLFLLIEGLRRKQLSLLIQEKMTQVGFVLLLMLMAFIIYNDMTNLGVMTKVKQLF